MTFVARPFARLNGGFHTLLTHSRPFRGPKRANVARGRRLVEPLRVPPRAPLEQPAEYHSCDPIFRAFIERNIIERNA
jgi:hypothetical protein